MRAAITLAIMFGSMTSAHAGNDIGVVAGGDTTQLAQISAQVTDWLSRHGYRVVAIPLPASSIVTFVECLGHVQPDRARQIVDEKARASAVVGIHVDQSQAETSTVIAYWFNKGRPAIIERRSCGSCTSAALMAAIDAVLADLLRRMRAGATMVVEMSPPATPHRSWQERDDSVLARALAPATMATGAAAIITGSILIAIDQDDRPNAPPVIRNSAPAGFAVSIAGVALAGVGAYLWFRRPAANASPTMAVTGNAAYVGWARRF